jgi:hypothetical protein
VSDIETLRRAAAKARELAEAATAGPWRSVPMGSEGSRVYNDGTTLRTTRRIARTPEFADGDLIAAMSPGVALAVADWLDRVAERSEAIASSAPPTVQRLAVSRNYDGEQALAVARALLREATP